jgi:hypothetical protein
MVSTWAKANDIYYGIDTGDGEFSDKGGHLLKNNQRIGTEPLINRLTIEIFVI